MGTADRPKRAKEGAKAEDADLLPRHVTRPRRLDVICDIDSFTLRLARRRAEAHHNASGGHRKTAKLGVSYAAGSTGKVELNMWSWDHSELSTLHNRKMISAIPPVPSLFTP